MSAPQTVTLPDGRRLAYARYGDPDGDPLVFHHGTPGSHVLGGLLADPAAAAGVDVVAPARPGYGASDLDDGAALDSWAVDCVALADALDLESFAVAGFSGGGPFALAVAERVPDRVAGVGVVAAPVPASDGGPFEALAGWPRLLGLFFRTSRWLARIRNPSAVAGQLTDAELPAETAETVARDFLAALDGGPAGAVRESRLLAGDWSLAAPEGTVRVWHGVEDGNVAVGPVRATWDDRTGAQFIEVDADHLGALLAVREELVGLAA